MRRVFIAYPGFREFSKGGKQDGGPSGLPSSGGPREGGESGLLQRSLGGVSLPVRRNKKFHSGPNFSLENQISPVRFSWSVFRLRSRPVLRQHLQKNGKLHARRIPPILSQLRKRAGTGRPRTPTPISHIVGIPKTCGTRKIPILNPNRPSSLNYSWPTTSR